MTGPLRPKIEKDGQPYVDEPVYLGPKPLTPLQRALVPALGIKQPGRVLVGHERVRLNWIRPEKP